MLEAVPWENPTYGISGGAAGNVAYGGTVNPPRNRKGGAGNPPPTGARASALPDSGASHGQNRGRETREDAVPRKRVTATNPDSRLGYANLPCEEPDALMRACPDLWGEGLGNDPSYPAPMTQIDRQNGPTKPENAQYHPQFRAFENPLTTYRAARRDMQFAAKFRKAIN